MKWLESKKGEEHNWYCWEAQIDSKPSVNTYDSHNSVLESGVVKAFIVGGHWLVDNTDGLLTSHVHTNDKEDGNIAEPLKATLLPVEVEELSPELRDENGNEIANSEKPLAMPKRNAMVEEDPYNNRIAHREMKVKIGKPLEGKKVTWTMQAFGVDETGAITEQQLMTEPFFSLNLAAENHAELLAQAFPSRTYAAGRNPVDVFNTPLEGRNYNMAALKNNWFSTETNEKRWLHSDIRDVGYLYTYKVYDKFKDLGKLDQ